MPKRSTENAKCSQGHRAARTLIHVGKAKWCSHFGR